MWVPAHLREVLLAEEGGIGADVGGAHRDVLAHQGAVLGHEGVVQQGAGGRSEGGDVNGRGDLTLLKGKGLQQSA
jgi:hypothetical protein